MKRKNSLKVIVIFMSVIAVLSGCGKKKMNIDLSNKVYNIAAGEKFTTYYPVSFAISSVEELSQVPVKLKVIETENALKNIDMLSNGEADFIMIQNDLLDYAYNGTNVFEGKKNEKLNAITSLYPETVQLITKEKYPIESVGSLAGKRVSVGVKDSNTYITVKNILTSYGVSLDDMYPEYLGIGDSVVGLINGDIDAFFIVSSAPNDLIKKLSRQVDIKFVDISGSQVESMLQNNTFYKKTAIPKELHGTKNDINTLSVVATLACNSSLSDEEVYNFTQNLYDNLSSMVSMTPYANAIILTNARNGITIPVHPGAEKYYKKMHIK